MSVPRLYEIDRALIFGTPGAFHDAVTRLVDLNETYRRKDRIHREILRAHIPIRIFAGGQLREISERYESPLLYHAAQIRGATLIETRVHAHRNLHRGESRQSVGNVRFWRRNETEVGGGVVEVHTVPGDQLAKIAAINHRQRIQAIDTGKNALRL